MNFSENLKKIRKENNLSQEQLAEKLGVSRQSVSKWESNQAYPEMDKMIQICKMFNLNMDVLLNQDVKEVKSNTKFKDNINKYIDEILDYITKTINMFSSFTFKEKIKCLFEQLLIVAFIILCLVVLYIVGDTIIYHLFSFLNYKIYRVISNIFLALYLVFSLIVGLGIVLHIFKTRYLDYYVIANQNEMKEENEIKVENEIERKETKKEKIVIRDPKHTGYKFISSLLKCLVFILKIGAAFIGILLSLSLIALVCFIILSFMFTKTGLAFIGVLLCLIALLIINILGVIIIYNFLVSKQIKKSNIFIAFITSLITFGIGIGIFIIGFTNFKFISNAEDLYDENKVISEKRLDMSDDLVILTYNDKIEYIESDNTDVKVIYESTNLYKSKIHSSDNVKQVYFEYKLKGTDLIKQIINDINSKIIIDYDSFNKIKIYSTKENIKKISDNLNKYLNDSNY